MKTQITLEQAKGKTLTGAIFSTWDAGLLLTFGDEFVCLASSSGYDGDSEIEEETLTHECLQTFPQDKLIEQGYTTQDELDAIQESLQQDRNARKEEQERASLARLKKKYGE